jgi:hypothetical protein
MVRPLWQLLLEDPSDLNCDECFALMAYYAELLAGGGIGLLPTVIERLKGYPDCETQYREVLRYLQGSHSDTSMASLPYLTESYGCEAIECPSSH